MSRIKLVLLSMVAMFGVSAVGAASASAHFFAACETRGVNEGQWSDSECSKAGGSANHTTKELASEFIEGESSETAEIGWTIASTRVTIGCGKTRVSEEEGSVEKGGKSKATILYSKCALYETSTGKENTKCEVPNITVKVKGELEGSPLTIKFGPETGSVLTELTIKGAICVEKIANAPMEGSMKCELPKAGAFTSLHSIICTAVGSNLTIDHGKASLKWSLSSKLRSAKGWAAM